MGAASSKKRKQFEELLRELPTPRTRHNDKRHKIDSKENNNIYRDEYYHNERDPGQEQYQNPRQEQDQDQYQYEVQQEQDQLEPRKNKNKKKQNQKDPIKTSHKEQHHQWHEEQYESQEDDEDDQDEDNKDHDNKQQEQEQEQEQEEKQGQQQDQQQEQEKKQECSDNKKKQKKNTHSNKVKIDHEEEQKNRNLVKNEVSKKIKDIENIINKTNKDGKKDKKKKETNMPLPVRLNKIVKFIDDNCADIDTTSNKLELQLEAQLDLESVNVHYPEDEKNERNKRKNREEHKSKRAKIDEKKKSKNKSSKNLKIDEKAQQINKRRCGNQFIFEKDPFLPKNFGFEFDIDIVKLLEEEKVFFTIPCQCKEIKGTHNGGTLMVSLHQGISDESCSIYVSIWNPFPTLDAPEHWCSSYRDAKKSLFSQWFRQCHIYKYKNKTPFAGSYWTPLTHCEIEDLEHYVQRWTNNETGTIKQQLVLTIDETSWETDKQNAIKKAQLIAKNLHKKSKRETNQNQHKKDVQEEEEEEDKKDENEKEKKEKKKEKENKEDYEDEEEDDSVPIFVSGSAFAFDPTLETDTTSVFGKKSRRASQDKKLYSNVNLLNDVIPVLKLVPC